MILAAILAVLGGIHVYWAFGGKWGASKAIPKVDGKPAFIPGFVATAAVAGLLFFGASIAAGLILLDYRRLLLAAMGLVFAARAIGDFRYVGFFKRITDSDFAWWDTRLYSPLCLALSALALFH